MVKYMDSKKYLVPKGYEIVKEQKRKPLKQYKKEDFEGLFYNGIVKKFGRYFVLEENLNYWFITRQEIGGDVVDRLYPKAITDLWPPLHIIKVRKIKKRH
jgi:hypothetical protein